MKKERVELNRYFVYLGWVYRRSLDAARLEPLSKKQEQGTFSIIYIYNLLLFGPTYGFFLRLSDNKQPIELLLHLLFYWKIKMISAGPFIVSFGWAIVSMA